jgi:hypothetical protein
MITWLKRFIRKHPNTRDTQNHRTNTQKGKTWTNH